MGTSPLVETSGASDANTYCSLDDANQYHDDRPESGTTWTDASDPDKTKALLFATRLMDDLVAWRGTPVDTTQALLWPRSGLMARNFLDYVDPDDGIPTELRDATAELCRQLLTDISRTDDSAIETLGITSLKAGPVSLSFRKDVRAKVMPDLVRNMLPPAWFSHIRGIAPARRRLVRV